MHATTQSKSKLHSSQISLIELLANQVASGHITQNELAEASGVHQSQISRILAGKALLASKNVIKLCKYAEKLPPSKKGSVSMNNETLANFARLLGKSSTEDQALAQLVASLNGWRKSYGSGK